MTWPLPSCSFLSTAPEDTPLSSLSACLKYYGDGYVMNRVSASGWRMRRIASQMPRVRLEPEREGVTIEAGRRMEDEFAYVPVQYWQCLAENGCFALVERVDDYFLLPRGHVARRVR